MNEEGFISGEDQNLPTHVSACLLRYKRLESKIDNHRKYLIGILAVLVMSGDWTLVQKAIQLIGVFK